jgi:hypothetical protein
MQPVIGVRAAGEQQKKGDGGDKSGEVHGIALFLYESA